jgi:hypothetical protein
MTDLRKEDKMALELLLRIPGEASLRSWFAGSHHQLLFHLHQSAQGSTADTSLPWGAPGIDYAQQWSRDDPLLPIPRTLLKTTLTRALTKTFSELHCDLKLFQHNHPSSWSFSFHVHPVSGLRDISIWRLSTLSLFSSFFILYRNFPSQAVDMYLLLKGLKLAQKVNSQKKKIIFPLRTRIFSTLLWLLTT